MAKVSNVDVLENKVFLCTRTNSTRRSLEFLINKVSQLDIPPADTVSAEKLNLMKTASGWSVRENRANRQL